MDNKPEMKTFSVYLILNTYALYNNHNRENHGFRKRACLNWYYAIIKK